MGKHNQNNELTDSQLTHKMPFSHCLFPKQKPFYGQGFTLFELLATIAIAGILMAIAVPSFNAAIRNNRLTATTNDFITSLNFARSEAVKRGQVVSVCKSSNGSSCLSDGNASDWSQGWIVFTNQNNNGAVDGTDLVLRIQAPVQNQITMVGDNLGGTGATDVRDRINYAASGMTTVAGLTTGVTGSILICDNRSGQAVGKTIAINSVGRPNLTERVVCP